MDNIGHLILSLSFPHLKSGLLQITTRLTVKHFYQHKEHNSKHFYASRHQLEAHVTNHVIFMRYYERERQILRPQYKFAS